MSAAVNPKPLTCRLFLDLEPGDDHPKPGDILVTVGKRGLGSGYLIVASRRVERRNPARLVRWTLRCHRMPIEEARALGPRWYMRWYSRQKS